MRKFSEMTLRKKELEEILFAALKRRGVLIGEYPHNLDISECRIPNTLSEGWTLAWEEAGQEVNELPALDNA